MQNLTGQTIKGYEIRNRIGVGGFGEVYLAYQPILDREVAIKAILSRYARQPEFIRSFEVEARYIARLEHAHIVPLYDFWREPSAAYLVMRYLRGGSLQDMIRVQGFIPPSDCARILQQVASALHLAHRNGIIHQDIKAANILLDEEQNAYLTDFGIATEVNAPRPSESKDQTIHGSPEYMSPEQILRAGITTRSDIYSLGIVLFEMLTGRKPFLAANDDDLIRKQVNERVPPLRDYRPELPEMLDIVIQRATDKNPRNRYATPVLMAENFNELIGVSLGAVVQPVREDSATRPRLLSVEDLIDPPNPYKGLRAFQESDALDFFGREREVEGLFQRLRGTGKAAQGANRFLAVIGASGSGKSSLVRAGLLPQLRRHSGDWLIVEMTPGTDPFVALSAALTGVAVDDEVSADRLRDDERGLAQAVEAVLGDFVSEMVLFIDQFEELFTLVQDRQIVERFLNSLMNAILNEPSRLRVVVTMRADFYHEPLRYPRFGELFSRRIETILPIDENGLRAAIQKPAERVGLKLEKGLVDQIIRDIEDQPGILPLLQFSLSELYNNRRGVTLTFEGYKASGGVMGAIARTADEIHYRLPPESKQVVRQIFLRLVTLGEGTEDTRRRVLLSELLGLHGDERLVRNVLDVFASRRLILFDNDPATRAPTVEIAHEALIRKWQVLREWLNDNRDNLRLHRKLIRLTNDWVAGNRDASYLAKGAQLTEIESLKDSREISLSKDERDYLETSISRRDREAQIRATFFVVLILFAFIASVAAMIAFSAERRASLARDLAQSRELAVQSRNVADYDLRALLSVKAVLTADTRLTRESLLLTLQARQSETGYIETYLPHAEGDVRAVAFSPSGQVVATGSSTGIVHLWSVGNWQIVGEPFVVPGVQINDLAFSPDSQRLAVAYSDHQVRLWELSDGTATILSGHTGVVRGLAFHPQADMPYLLSVAEDSTARLWDLDDGTHQVIRAASRLFTVAFAPSGEFFALGEESRQITLWDFPELTPRGEPLAEHTSIVRSLAFNPSGAVLASGGADGQVILWSVANASRIGEPIVGHGNAVRDVAFVGGGALVSVGDDGRAFVWRANGTLLDQIPLDLAQLRSVSVSPDNQRIVFGGIKPSATVFSLASRSRIGRLLENASTEPSAVVAFQPDGTAISLNLNLNNRNDPDIQLWSSVGQQATVPPARHSIDRARLGIIGAIAISPSGGSVLIGNQTGEIFIISTADGQIRETIGTGRQLAILSVAYSHDERQIAVGYVNGLLIVLQRQDNGWQVRQEIINAHRDRILALDFSRDGSRVAAGSRDNVVSVWDVGQGRRIADLPTLHTDAVIALRFDPSSPSGEILVTGGRDNQLIAWDLRTTPVMAHVLTDHSDWVMALDFKEDGSMLASGSRNNIVFLWDTTAPDAIPRRFNSLFNHATTVHSLRFSPDERYLLVGTEGGTVAWSVAPEDWIATACRIANRQLTPEEWTLFIPDMTYNAYCQS